ncbi:MAG TPA: D-xylose ABC transporter ATP-binding protein, partial [Coriobacteriia bacterium]|nr:D-xylose ABC transporter ATP-binding protein [Coriobacteriia bacterium]
FASRLGFMRRGAIEGYATTVVDEFRVATPSTRQKVLNLSGGNQQKCLVALWMGIEPEVIILDEPTRGVDVGARMEIYQKVRECAAGGAGVILISSDLPELIGMCDRILVMHHGRISGEVERESFSEERILAYAAGVDLGS